MNKTCGCRHSGRRRASWQARFEDSRRWRSTGVVSTSPRKYPVVALLMVFSLVRMLDERMRKVFTVMVLVKFFRGWAFGPSGALGAVVDELGSSHVPSKDTSLPSKKTRRLWGEPFAEYKLMLSPPSLSV